MRPTKTQYDVAYKAAMKPGATDADKLALARMLSAACAEEVVSDITEEEKIRAILDKAAIDALGKQLGKPEGTAHATITATETTIDVLVEFTPSAEALAAYRRAVEKTETDVFKAIAGGDLQQAGNVPFFTPSPAPIPPTAYHNVFPPITSESIQDANPCEQNRDDYCVLCGEHIKP